MGVWDSTQKQNHTKAEEEGRQGTMRTSLQAKGLPQAALLPGVRSPKSSKCTVPASVLDLYAGHRTFPKHSQNGSRWGLQAR